MLRYTKRIVGFIALFTIVYVIFKESNHVDKLKRIYKLQEDLAEVLLLEMQYMAREMYSEDDRWIKVHSGPGHIYSAYLDIRPEIVVKYSVPGSRVTWGEIFIIALLPTKTRDEELSCVLKFEQSDRSTKNIYIPARLKLLEDHWNLEYAAFYVICDLKYPTGFNTAYDMYDNKQLPESVGLHWKKVVNRRGTNFVDIHYPEQGWGGSPFYEETEKGMAVCVPVLHHNFNRAQELVEFIEYYRMMGIDHFTFYNSSVSPEVDKVLQFYQVSLTASVLNWTLPSVYVYEQTLRQQGLYAALNDCLYRNTHFRKYKYIGVFDVDEFLIPKRHSDFHKLMASFDIKMKQNSTDRAAFLFRNAYFYTMYPDATKGKTPYLYTREKTRRLRQIHEVYKGSRYFVRGEDVFELGNYNIWEFRQGSLERKIKAFNEYVADPQIALVHHYAPCEAEDTACYLKSIVIDRSAQKYSGRLGRRVNRVCQAIFPEYKCPPPVKRVSGRI